MNLQYAPGAGARTSDLRDRGTRMSKFGDAVMLSLQPSGSVSCDRGIEPDAPHAATCFGKADLVFRASRVRRKRKGDRRMGQRGVGSAGKIRVGGSPKPQVARI